MTIASVRRTGWNVIGFFFNDETYRLYSFIASTLFLFCLGILYLLGRNDGSFGIAVGILAGVCFLAGLGLDGRIRQYE